MPSLKRCISVYEPHASYYAQLGRIMVTYDVKLNSWHCPCARSRRSCLHKYIAKWHLFQTEHQLFRTVQSTDQTTQVHESVDDAGLLYPPTKELESMIRYVMNNKTIPAALPEHLRLPSFSSTYFPMRCSATDVLEMYLYQTLCSSHQRPKFLQIQELSMVSNFVPIGSIKYIMTSVLNMS